MSRPTIDPSGARRRALSFRTTPELYARMQAAAAASGRSLTQEIELRLERSFADEEIAGTLSRIERKVGTLSRIEQKVEALSGKR
jgi:hypothetical protein